MDASSSSETGANPTDEALLQILESTISRIQGGESLDVEQLVKQHPQYARELRELLPAASLMLAWGRSQRPHPNGTRRPDAIDPAESLGDFRLLREIGRGGMGVVYEAEQLSLGRRVAVKVLPLASMLDRQRLARFQNEARAAATLNHPHIVPVYAVGCDRGVHYYAMQLVEGSSLAQILETIRRQPRRPDHGGGSSVETSSDAAVEGPASASISTIPEFSSRRYCRRAAQLIAEAAESLEHAHARGILHRDVKPANLLVDETGKLWVTDFGLANLGGDGGLTATGDLVGTLRYMSPEQALGKRGLIDHRADVYSLGATLYELVTLRPVYDATDREELLRKIALEEPVRLRLVNRDAPVDLETIVAKTLEKDPAARYATAGELADDLRRFLVAQPILAKPATLIERAVKYVRRHRGLVATAAVALACLIAVLLVSTVLVARAHRRALVALERTSDLLYASDMKLAYEAWERGWDDEVRTLLDRHLPRPGAVDQRGLEWRILDSQVRHPNPVELKGHRGAIQELAVFPNRQAVASVGDDGWLRIWDIAAARQAHAVKISSQPLFAVAVSPSGRYVAVGGMDSAVYLCDAQAEYAARSLYVGGFAVESLAFSPDGQRLAAGFRYDELCLLSIAGDLIQRVPCAARALSLQFVPGTSLLLAPERMLGKPGSPTVVQLWRDDLSQVVQTFDRLDEARPIQTNLAIASPCGQLVLAVEQSKSQAFIFHRTTGRLLSSIPKTRDRILDVAYSPVGDAVAFAYGNGNIEYVSLQRRSDEEVSIAGRRRAMAAHLGEVYCLRFIDDSTLASAGRDGCVRIWRLTVDRPQRPAKGGEPPRRIALSPDGSALACVYRREIVVVDVASERPLFRLGITPGDHDISWSSSSQIIADRPSDAAGPLQLLGRRGEVLWNAPSAMDLEELTVSSDAALAATIGQSQLRLYSVRDRRLLLERALPDTGRHAAFSPRGDMLALGGSWRGATILNLRDSRAATTLACASDTLVLAFSADGLRAASGHSDGAVRVWNSSTGALSATFVGHAAPVHSALFAPDGRTLLTVGVDGAVRIWSVDPPRGYGVVYQSANGESNELPDVGISTDGRWFTIADVDEQGMPVVWRRNVGAATP